MQVHSFPKGTGMLLNHASAVPDASMSLRVLLEDWYKQKLFTVCVGSYGPYIGLHKSSTQGYLTGNPAWARTALSPNRSPKT